MSFRRTNVPVPNPFGEEKTTSSNLDSHLWDERSGLMNWARYTDFVRMVNDCFMITIDLVTSHAR